MPPTRCYVPIPVLYSLLATLPMLNSSTDSCLLQCFLVNRSLWMQIPVTTLRHTVRRVSSGLQTRNSFSVQVAECSVSKNSMKWFNMKTKRKKNIIHKLKRHVWKPALYCNKTALPINLCDHTHSHQYRRCLCTFRYRTSRPIICFN